MERCEICGKKADRHHIVFKSEGGLDFPLNIKYLCDEHHRGINGPHKNRRVDIMYKLELQDNLNRILIKNYYSITELSSLIGINKRLLRRLLSQYKMYKEGYKKSDIIFRLMGDKVYDIHMLRDFYSITAPKQFIEIASLFEKAGSF